MTTEDDGVDAVPGDGVCEMTVGAGDCSLRAAFAEANAAPRGEVVAPVGWYVLDLTPAADSDGDADIDITGDVLFTGDPFDGGTYFGDHNGLEISTRTSRAFDVAASARFEAEYLDIEVNLSWPSGIRVDGTLVLDRSLVGGGTATPGIDVRAGGTARITSSYVAGVGAPAVSNAGEVVAAYSTITGVDGVAIDGATGASTDVGATRINRYFVYKGVSYLATGSPVCTGTTPTSAGWNHVINTTCALGGTDDVETNATTWQARIPAGTFGCGGSFDIDAFGRARPDAGTGACDVGAEEVP
ncbi:MAG: hypothetical protein KF906_02840 [Actinobacteria bacterium]|nr:hypothetical protein [Actinomycetota bacterium]